MKNLEQTLAKTILEQYNFYERMWRDNAVSTEYFTGQKIAVMSIAMSIWGQDITSERSFDFLSNLEKIATSEPKANLVEVNRFEAFGLSKHYGVKSVNAMHEGFAGASQSYWEKGEKWLDIATKIEQTNADGFNKDLMHI